MLPVVALLLAPVTFAGEAKKNYTKALVSRVPFEILPNATAATPFTGSLLDGLSGNVLEEYEHVTLVEIHRQDKEKLKERAKRKSLWVALRDEFDEIRVNDKVLDARDGSDKVPPGFTHDPPYRNDEQGTWLIQFIGPIKEAWLNGIRKAGIVPVQSLALNAYIVGARETAVRAAAKLPFIQWTLQMHRFLKPSIGAPTEQSLELWIQVALTDETDDTVGILSEMAEGPIQSAPWSDTEVRVQGVFETSELDLILSLPLVIAVAERPTFDLSGEREALAAAGLDPRTTPRDYKTWLNNLCPSCTNLQGDGFYIGIADTGLDGGSHAANPPGQVPSSGLHRDELANDRIRWGLNFQLADTTGSKHDTFGHGTLVAGIAAGNPGDSPPADAKDPEGLLWGLGVAPSAGIVVTKIDINAVASQNPSPVDDLTQDALVNGAYWQNFSLNQYNTTSGQACDQYYDGAYSTVSRDFDQAVIDGDLDTVGTQPITLTVSSGNVPSQGIPSSPCAVGNRFMTLPPATAKNVIAVGGAENVRPDQWFCGRGARSDEYSNLSISGKRGTATPGWYKPDLIAVSSSVTSSSSHDVPTIRSYFCDSSTIGFEPPAGDRYRGATGTSFAAPVALGAAVLAARRFSSTPGAASPALIKAMLVAGATSMRGGMDRGGLLPWRPTCNSCYRLGDLIIPRTPNGHSYELDAILTGPNQNHYTSGEEPIWPQDGTTVTDQDYRWKDKGPATAYQIGAFPNDQQGFGRIYLGDVLSQAPSRVYINDQALAAAGTWTARYTVDDLSKPVRLALAWTDGVALAGSRTYAPLQNDLDLSVEWHQNGQCLGRYLGNRLDAEEKAVVHPCVGTGNEDRLNNVEIARFEPTAQRGDTTFTVRVASASGQDQNFALVVWNAKGTPPLMPAGFSAVATSTSQAQLNWTDSAGATSYEVQRGPSINGPFVSVACAVSGCADAGLAADTTYVYRVRAVSAGGDSEWAVDPARTTVFTDSSFTAGVTVIKTAHVIELRQAIAGLRAAGGLSVFAWSDHPSLGGILVKSAHVAELRTALTEARAAFGLTTAPYTDGVLTPQASAIRAIHVEELRQGVR